MMIRPLLAALFIISALCAPSAAHAEEAYAVAKVNLRAGPDGGYPVVDILKANERVDLLGCVVSMQWCEVETRSGEHGWIYANYLATRYQDQSTTVIQLNGGNLRIITFDPDTYWNTYYRTKYFYPNRYQWIPRDGGGHGHHHDHNDDDDDHGSPTPRPRPQKPEPAPLKYQPMKTPGDGKYNPLCPMGQDDC